MRVIRLIYHVLMARARCTARACTPAQTLSQARPPQKETGGLAVRVLGAQAVPEEQRLELVQGGFAATAPDGTTANFRAQIV